MYRSKILKVKSPLCCGCEATSARLSDTGRHEHNSRWSLVFHLLGWAGLGWAGLGWAGWRQSGDTRDV